jgi:hypothetical protein
VTIVPESDDFQTASFLDRCDDAALRVGLTALPYCSQWTLIRGIWNIIRSHPSANTFSADRLMQVKGLSSYDVMHEDIPMTETPPSIGTEDGYGDREAKPADKEAGRRRDSRQPDRRVGRKDDE